MLPALLIACPAQSALVSLAEEELSEVGGGIGIVLSDVMFIGEPNASIQLTFDSVVGAVANSDSGFLDHIALFGSQSNASCADSPTTGSGIDTVDCQGIQVGDINSLSTTPDRLINFNISTESGVSYAELKWPTLAAVTADNSIEPGMDLHFRVVTSGVKVGLGFPDDFFADVTWWRVQNLKLAGSSLRAWGSGALNSLVKEVNTTTGFPTNENYNRNPAISGSPGLPVGVGFAANINATFDLVASVANSDVVNQNEQYKKFPGGGSGDDGGRFNGGIGAANHADNQSRVELSNVSLSNLSLGFFPHLPLVFGSIDRATSGGNDKAPDFYLEVPMVPNDTGVSGIATQFYANSPKANLSVEQFQIGSTSSPSPNPIPTNVAFVMGTNAANPAMQITGLRVQHLRIETNAN